MSGAYLESIRNGRTHVLAIYGDVLATAAVDADWGSAVVETDDRPPPGLLKAVGTYLAVRQALVAEARP